MWSLIKLQIISCTLYVKSYHSAQILNHYSISYPRKSYQQFRRFSSRETISIWPDVMCTPLLRVFKEKKSSLFTDCNVQINHILTCTFTHAHRTYASSLCCLQTCRWLKVTPTLLPACLSVNLSEWHISQKTQGARFSSRPFMVTCKFQPAGDVQAGDT